jgi:YesN/AraC family two-component response regulator
MATALIADDEAMLRAQLKARLAEAWPELAVIAEAANGAEALAQYEVHRPEIVFLDIRMPVKTGVEVAHALAGRAMRYSSPPMTNTRSPRSTKAR